MMGRRTGRGATEKLLNPPSLLLYNFDVDSAVVKFEHMTALRKQVVTPLQKGGSVSIVGLASRTGTETHNQHLSELRANRVLAFLRSEVRGGFNARQVTGLGELQARLEGYPNNSEDPRFRSVVVLTAGSPVPPPPPTVVELDEIDLSKADDESLNLADVLDYFSKALDIGVGVSGLLELVPVEAVSEFFGTFGLFLTVVSSVVQMPIMWYGVKDQNEKNGTLQGFWEALQDMATQYKERNIGKKLESEWPALREPKPRQFGIPSSDLPLNEREWMNGRTQGCKIAFAAIQEMQKNPKPAKNNPKIMVTGRLYLAYLYRRYGDNISETFQNYFDQKFKAAGKRGWPLRDF